MAQRSAEGGGLFERVVRLRDELGASAVEYGLLIALIAVLIIGAVTLLGGNLRDIFQEMADLLPDP